MSGRIKKYLIFARAGAQEIIAYRGMIVLWVFGALLNAVIMGLLWWAIFSFSPESVIGGYTYPQMLLYVILTAVVGEITYSGTMGSITDDVRAGVIGMRLMKPVSYRGQLGFSSFGGFLMRTLIFGIPLIVAGTLIAVFGFGLEGLTWYNILGFIPAIMMSALFKDALEFLFGQLAFRTQAMFGVSTILQVIVMFLSGAMVPLTLFPGWAQNILMYTPFPSLVSFPVRLFLGQLTATETLVGFGISALWLVALNVIGSLLYKTSVRHVVVFGG